MQTHPKHREGRRVTEVGDGLHELRPPKDLKPENPGDGEEFRADVDAQRVWEDPVSVVDQKDYHPSALPRSRRLLTSLLFCLSWEGWRSLRLQRHLRLLYRAIVESRLHCGSWPASVAPLIQNHRLRDPWRPKEPLQVIYTPPTEGMDALSRQHMLAEYVREGKRKFALCADGHQETWRL